MIKSLHIQNFQSHEDTHLDLHEGVNVITGVPNSGKTAILRLLQWIDENRPSGASFMPTFAGNKCQTKGTIILDDDTKVELEKSLRINKKGERVVDDSTYRLNLLGKEKRDQKFSTGTSVPDVIEKVLNFDDLNIQGQLDSPFLITSSAGEIARTINRITHLENVDEWISILTTRINKLKQQDEFLGDEIKALEEKLDQYKDIPKLEDIVGQLEKLEKKLNEVNYRWIQLDKNIDLLISIGNQIEQLTNKVKADNLFRKIVILNEKVEKYQKEIHLINQLKIIENKRNDTFNTINETNAVWDELTQVNEVLKHKMIDQEKLSSAIDVLKKIGIKMDTIVKALGKEKTEYMEAIEGMDMCPIFNVECPVKSDILATSVLQRTFRE